MYTAAPGTNATLMFYIFNAYGNRITHVTLSVTNNPQNLDVQFPPLYTKPYIISGIKTDIVENLFVCNLSIVEEQPAIPIHDDFCYNDTIYYLRTTNITGYIPAKKVEIKVKIPENAEYGATYEVTIGVVARWYDEFGTSQVNQARSFPVKIRIASETYSEEPYTPEAGGFTPSNELIIGGVIALLVIIILYQQFKPKRHR